MLVLVLPLLLLAGSANGAYPGRNGLIVFSSGRSPLNAGEILSINADGTGRKQLTSDWARQRGAVHAPRGTLVAYVGSNGLYVMRDDGTARKRVAKSTRLGNGCDSECRVNLWWSRDGRWLAFAEEPRSPDGTEYELSVIRSDGTGRRSLGACPRVVCAASWLADSRTLVVSRSHGLAVVDSRSSVSRALTADATDSGPVVSPDGKSVAFQAKAGLSIVGVDGGGRRLLARLVCLSFSWSPNGKRLACATESELTVVSLAGSRALIAENLASPGFPPAWAPDGSKIAFTYNRGISGDPDTIWVVTPDGRNARQVTNEQRGGVVGPSWSPDGSRIFASVFGSGGYDLWTIRANGAGLRRLTDDVRFDGQPSWSPDGKRLAWRCADDRDAADNLCVMNADGTGRRVVVRGAIAPSWSPDGTALAFARWRGGISIVRTDGTGLRALTSDKRDTSPAWSPDGRMIAFANERYFSGEPGTDDDTAVEHLYVIRVDGTGRRLVRTSGPEDPYDPMPSWAPDGRRIAVVDGPGPRFPAYCEDGSRNPDCSHLFVVRLTDGRSTPLRVGGSYGSNPVWSPDGRHVVFRRNGDLTVAAVGARSARKLLRAQADGSSDDTPDWQPLCTLYGTERADTLRGTPGADVICGLGGGDRIDARGGNDIVIGGDGDDTIVGGAGVDRLFGAFGDDTIVGGVADVVNLGPGG